MAGPRHVPESGRRRGRQIRCPRHGCRSCEFSGRSDVPSRSTHGSTALHAAMNTLNEAKWKLWPVGPQGEAVKICFFPEHRTSLNQLPHGKRRFSAFFCLSSVLQETLSSKLKLNRSSSRLCYWSMASAPLPLELASGHEAQSEFNSNFSLILLEARMSQPRTHPVTRLPAAGA